MSEKPKKEMSVLEKLSSYQGKGQADTLVQMATWNMLLASELLKKKNGENCHYAQGCLDVFLKLDGWRWISRFFGIFPTLNALVTKVHLKQPTTQLQTIHLIKNVLWFLYNPLERLAWLKTNAPGLVQDFKYDGVVCGRASVKCWIINMIFDFYLMFRRYQKYKQDKANSKISSSDYKKEMGGLFWNFIQTAIWFPVAVNWASENPFLDGLQTGAICSFVSGIQLALSWNQ